MKVDIALALPCPADQAWELAGSFNSLPLISTATATSQLEDGGRLRVLVNRDGSILWEKLLHFDEKARTLSYCITDSKAFGGAYGRGYVGRVTIEAVDTASSTFLYSADFEPAAGFDEDTAKQAVEKFAIDCVQGILRCMTARQPL